MSDKDTLYDTEGAARFLQDNYKTGTRASLSKARHFGNGPRFYLLGRSPRYRESDLRAWAEGRMSARAYNKTREYISADEAA
jgi:hypothetical protein